MRTNANLRKQAKNDLKYFIKYHETNKVWISDLFMRYILPAVQKIYDFREFKGGKVKKNKYTLKMFCWSL